MTFQRVEEIAAEEDLILLRDICSDVISMEVK
jgi:hypothetical protein